MKKAGSRVRVCRLGMQVGLAVFVIVIWRLFETVMHEQPVPSIPVVLLKIPRSGSSWFTSELNALPSVYISKEIVQGEDAESFSTTEIEAHLIAALRGPKGKLSNSRAYFPDSRYMEDYLKPMSWSWKPMTNLQVVGFSVNPEHIPDVDWSRIKAAVPELRVIALARSNIIKSAMSGFTGELLKEKCGSANLRAGDKRIGGCDGAIPVKVPWSYADFLLHIKNWKARADHFDHTVEKVGEVVGTKNLQRVHYEDLQQDVLGNLSRVLEGVGARVQLTSARASQWKKRGSESLQDTLEHFDEIRERLQATGGACSCLLLYLMSTTPEVLPCEIGSCCD
jgi:LPS sulfotransferase NodH